MIDMVIDMVIYWDFMEFDDDLMLMFLRDFNGILMEVRLDVMVILW